MNSSGVVVWSICSLLLIFIFIMFIYLALPIHYKYVFDDICSDYSYKALIEGGITDKEKTELILRLKSKKFYDVKINITKYEKYSYGKRINFLVSCKFKYKIVKDIFKFEEKEGILKYEKNSFSKKVTN